MALVNFRDEKGEPSELIANLEGFAENDCDSLEGIRSPHSFALRGRCPKPRTTRPRCFTLFQARVRSIAALSAFVNYFFEKCRQASQESRSAPIAARRRKNVSTAARRKKTHPNGRSPRGIHPSSRSPQEKVIQSW